MIAGVRRRLIYDVSRRAAELHPLALEAKVADAGLVLVAIGEVVDEEEGEALDAAEEGALDGDLLDLGGARELELLGGRGVLGGGEVEVVAVDEDLEGARGGGGV